MSENQKTTLSFKNTSVEIHRDGLTVMIGERCMSSKLLDRY